jgi:Zn-finger nucleic acid-binding protein
VHSRSGRGTGDVTGAFFGYIDEGVSMLCPHDQSVLVMTERQGVEIDYCPQCRGVWLDRGELDKIMERAQTGVAPAGGPDVPGAVPPGGEYRHTGPVPPPHPGDERSGRWGGEPRYDDRRYDGDRGDDRYGRKRKKKESWVGELFDF